MKNPSPVPATFVSRLRQRGLSLVFALLALVALTLGAVALLRSVDVGVLVLGNLGDKQTGLAATGQGAEAAMRWIADRINTPPTLHNDIPDEGYYATHRDTLDVTGIAAGHDTLTVPTVDWEGNGCVVEGVQSAGQCLSASPAMEVGGETVRYLITRLCPSVGEMTSDCARPPFENTTKASDRDAETAGVGSGRVGVDQTSAYFRIVVRSKNARGTVAFSETLAHY